MALWTEVQDQKLKQLYEEDYSTAQIAAFFTDKSRNAIIGRIHRIGKKLGLIMRGSGNLPAKAVRAERRPRTRNPEKPKRFVPPMEETKLRCAAIEPLHLSIPELEPDHCRYPYGEGPFTFCGHKKFQGSYCAAHYYLTIGSGTASEQGAHRIPRRVRMGVG
jgi:GcrA cell cycle regulator